PDVNAALPNRTESSAVGGNSEPLGAADRVAGTAAAAGFGLAGPVIGRAILSRGDPEPMNHAAPISTAIDARTTIASVRAFDVCSQSRSVGVTGTGAAASSSSPQRRHRPRPPRMRAPQHAQMTNA